LGPAGIHSPQASTRAITLQESFSGRHNSIAFLRWLFAVLVVVDHSYSTGGFHHGQGPLGHWAAGQASLGDIAVLGFFILSGFLVTRSRDRMPSGGRYMWHRFLRIFPGFWVCLLVTAFVLAPIEWQFETNQSLSTLFSFRNGPFQYIRHNFLLTIHQWEIGTTLSNTPLASRGSPAAWDGSLWTLIYEFRCYVVVALICVAISQVFRRRAFVALTIGTGFVLATLKVDPHAGYLTLIPFATSLPFVRFTFCFLLGALAYYYAEYIPVRREAIVAAAIVFLYTLHSGGFYFIGYLAMAYCVMCAAVLLPLVRWDRFGDLSYGIYIYAFPAQMMLAAHGFQRFGLFPFIAVSIVLSSLAAFASWHLVEKWALRLKGVAWPRRLRLGLAGARPASVVAQSTADEG
jgi:peptidoglycan/LPS O-acetylase OafA/YrhL